MVVQEWLESVMKLDYMVDNLVEEIQHLTDVATKITGSSDGMPHGSGVSDKINNTVVKIVDLQIKCNDMVDAFIDRKYEVISKLEKLCGTEYQVMYLKYVKYKTWGEIADIMHYSTRQVHRIKDSALMNLEKMSQDVTQCH